MPVLISRPKSAGLFGHQGKAQQIIILQWCQVGYALIVSVT